MHWRAGCRAFSCRLIASAQFQEREPADEMHEESKLARARCRAAHRGGNRDEYKLPGLCNECSSQIRNQRSGAVRRLTEVCRRRLALEA
jgi:hypothetical protein